jgi:hypothetical protein
MQHILKVTVDASPTRNGQFLLTGSQKFTLMKSVPESLAGRGEPRFRAESCGESEGGQRRCHLSHAEQFSIRQWIPDAAGI